MHAMRIVALNDAETTAIRRATRRAAAAQTRALHGDDISEGPTRTEASDTASSTSSRGADVNLTLHRCTQKLQAAVGLLRADRAQRARLLTAAGGEGQTGDDEAESIAERIQQTELLCRAINDFAQASLLPHPVLPALRDEYDAVWRRAALLCTDSETTSSVCTGAPNGASAAPPTAYATVQRSASASAAAAAAAHARSGREGDAAASVRNSASVSSGASAPSTPLGGSLSAVSTSSVRRMTAASRLGRAPRPSTSHQDCTESFDGHVQQQVQFTELDANTDPALVAHERARLAEVQSVHAHAREVAALQADFAALVASQEAGIAKAEAQTAEAADHISYGRKQLAKAIKVGAFAATVTGAAVGAVLGGPIVGIALLGAQSALTVGAATAAGGVVGVAAANAVNSRTKASVNGAEHSCDAADAATDAAGSSSSSFARATR